MVKKRVRDGVKQNRGVKRGIPDEILLESLRSFSRTHGRAPLSADLGRKNHLPNVGTLRLHFGSFNNSLHRAGLPLSRTALTNSASNDDLIEELKAFYRQTGRIPKKSDFGKKNNRPSLSTLRRRFGSHLNTLRRAGLPISRRDRTMMASNEDLLEELREFHKIFGRSPQDKDLGNRNGRPSPVTYRNRFVRLSNALRLAGLPISKRNQTLSASREELLEELRKFYRQYGRPPNKNDFGKHHQLPGLNTYRRQFRNLTAALRLAGLPISKFACTQSSSNQEILEKLKAFYGQTGRIPKKSDFGKNGDLPSLATFRKRFGSYLAALQQAGLAPSRAALIRSASDKDLLGLLYAFYRLFGCAPTINNLGKHGGLPSLTVYHHRFGNFHNALSLARIPDSALNVHQLRERRSLVARQAKKKEFK